MVRSHQPFTSATTNVDRTGRLCRPLTAKRDALSQSLVHVAGKRSAPLTLVSMPNEIISSILNHMHDPASETALGLTCKKIYNVYEKSFIAIPLAQMLLQITHNTAMAGRPHLPHDPVRLNVYTRSLPKYMPLHELIRDFFPKDLVYWDGGYDGTPMFVTKERLAQLIEMDKPFYAGLPRERHY